MPFSVSNQGANAASINTSKTTCTVSVGILHHLHMYVYKVNIDLAILILIRRPVFMYMRLILNFRGFISF